MTDTPSRNGKKKHTYESRRIFKEETPPTVFPFSYRSSAPEYHAFDKPPTLYASYKAWAEHQRRCPTCVQEDWYMPGEVCFVYDPLLADKTITTTKNGKPHTTYARRAPDVSVLCVEGRKVFGAWCALARLYETISGRPYYGDKK